MPVLSDNKIKEMIQNEELIVENFDMNNLKVWNKCTLEGHLSDNEAEFFKITEHKEMVDLDGWEDNHKKKDFYDRYQIPLQLKLLPNTTKKYYMLDSGELILVYTKERFKIPLESKIMAHVQGKSGLARLGISNHVTAPIIHPGFGSEKPLPIMLEIYNHSHMSFRIYPGMPFCQFMFESVEGEYIDPKISGFGVNQIKSA